MSLDRVLSSLAPGGRDFERLCKWLLDNVPEYRSKLKQVWLWNDWPAGTGRDIGIDLVAEDHEGGLWAIQAKHYDAAYSVKKADIDSFLSASSRAEFTYRLLIATTDHVAANARSTIAIQEKPVGMLLRSQLELLHVEWPTDPSDLRPARPEPRVPRPHQLTAIDECMTGLAIADRGQLVMACGTGKTLIGPFLAERVAAQRVLVLVPSLSLLAQTLREWATAIEFDYLAVCSDETVTKDEQDAVVASTSELGVPVTTDPDRIARFLHRRGNELKVVLATYQSSPQIAAAQTSRVPAFDLVIADEAHRCAGPQAGVFATVLDATKIKGRKRLFVTATPRYFTGRVKREAKEADWEVASMDDEEKFGGVLHRLTFSQAIDQDLLSDYQVVVVGVTDREARDLAERGAFVTRDGESVTDARTLARQIGLLRSMAKYDLHRVVTFHSRIDHASRFASSLLDTKEWLPAERRPGGPLWTDHVSGKMTAGERDARLRRLKAVEGGERAVLTNARCLNEGVDVPTLDGVAFIDPRRSQVDVVQAVGRAIRKADDKMRGTIVIPVLIEENSDPEEALASSEFDRVWEIVLALRDHDGDLAEALDELRRGVGLRGSLGERPPKIVLDAPVGIGNDFARAFDARLVEAATASWEYWVGLLERFVAREGHALVPQRHDEDGFPLGGWVSNQRRGLMSETRRRRLEALPGWHWDANQAPWEQGLAALRQFHRREGHARVPQGHREDGFRLGVFVSHQRQAHRDHALGADRVADLEAVPGWTWDEREANWSRAMSALRRFAKREGDAAVPARHVEGGLPLGQFVHRQRAAFKRGTLDVARVHDLEAISGWRWTGLADQWGIGYQHLQRFAARERHARVPTDWKEDGYALGTFVVRQRSFYRGGSLSDERIAKLEEIDGWTWGSFEARWEMGFTHVSRFAKREGHAAVPTHYVEDGFALGQWVYVQRRAAAKGELSRERIRRLASVEGWVWSAFDARWEGGFRVLSQFASSHGHTDVPSRYRQDDFELGQWVGKQRQAFKAGKLSADRTARLEALPGWSWSARATT